MNRVARSEGVQKGKMHGQRRPLHLHFEIVTGDNNQGMIAKKQHHGTSIESGGSRDDADEAETVDVVGWRTDKGVKVEDTSNRWVLEPIQYLELPIDERRYNRSPYVGPLYI